MATIRRKGDMQWHCQIRKKGFPSQTRTFNTRAEAEAWAKLTEAEMIRGVFVSRAEAEATTLADALDRYKREFTIHKKSAFSEGKKIDAWKRHKLASRFLASLRPTDFAAYRDERLDAGKKASTVRLELAVISHLFTVAAKEWGMPLQNPVQNIRKPRLDNARDRRLSEEEERYLLAAIDNPGSGAGIRRNVWVGPMVRLALETSMRRGELLSLEWKRIDLERCFAVLPDTKNGEGRAVPLSSRAVAILNGIPRSIGGKVFPTTANAFRISFDRALKRAKKNYIEDCKNADKEPEKVFLEDLHFHDTRHEATSRLFEKGLNQIEAASVTGHKTLQMLKRYTHLNAEKLAKKLG